MKKVKVSDGLKALGSPTRMVKVLGGEMPLLDTLQSFALEHLAAKEQLDLRQNDLHLLENYLRLYGTEVVVVYGECGAIVACLSIKFDPQVPRLLPDYAYKRDGDSLNEIEVHRLISNSLRDSGCGYVLVTREEFVLDEEEGAMTFAEAVELNQRRIRLGRELHEQINDKRPRFSCSLQATYGALLQDLKLAESQFEQAASQPPDSDD